MTRPRIMTSVVVVALALTTAVAVPTICVLSALVALNFVLGRRENVPSSTYPMFSSPGGKAWALRFEGPCGERFPIADMGISPQVAKKRFGTEVSAAHVRGVTDLTEARRLGAEAIAPLWTATAGTPVSTPTVVNGIVYAGSESGGLYAFDAAGSTGCSGTPKTCAPLSGP